MPIILLAFLWFTEPVFGEIRVSGYTKSTLLMNEIESNPLLEFSRSYESQNNFRLMVDGFGSNLSWQIHYEISPVFTSRSSLSQTFQAQEATYRAYDLDQTISAKSRKNKTFQNLDRLNLQFQFEKSDLTLGRQSIDLGSARMISPTDIFVPFNLQTLNTEYRIGIDAIRYQRQFSELSGIDAGIILGDEAQSDNSAAFIKLQANLKGTDYKFTVVEYAKQSLYSFGAESSLRELGFWLEVAYVRGDEDYELASSGADFSLNEKIFLQLEYHFNGAGSDDPSAYQEQARKIPYRKGGVTLLGEHYLLPSVSIQVSPFFNMVAGGVFNLSDNSSFVSLVGEWSISENFYIDVGWYHFSGKDFSAEPTEALALGSEYGLNSDLLYTSFKFYF
ncbi:MAG: hypothetical protein CMQ40_05695 [Gammaproteobacteria bacterium]|nr:hypothetical protein [Gammaproteobacteria bacterium]